MKHDRQMALLDRMVELRKRRHIQLFNSETVHLSLDHYTSQEIFERELQTVFSDCPFVAGHVHSVREPGQYMLSDWNRQPYVVVRGHDGVLRAFMNTCRHRGAPLVDRESDKPLHAFVCPFHGWTYGLDGALRGVPREFAFPGINKRELGLKELPVTESTGLVWIHPREHGPLAPVEDLGSFSEDFEHYKLDGYVRYKKVVNEKKANWKLLIQLNLEGYHVAMVHKGTVAGHFRNGFLAHDAEGAHLRILAAKTNLMDSVGIPEEKKTLSEFVLVAYVLFPNAFIIMHKDDISIRRLFPIAPDRTLYSHEFLYLPDRYVGESGRKALKNRFLYNEVLFDDQDFAMAEKVQQNLCNGVNDSHMLGLEEGLVLFFQECINKQIESSLSGQAASSTRRSGR